MVSQFVRGHGVTRVPTATIEATLSLMQRTQDLFYRLVRRHLGRSPSALTPTPFPRRRAKIRELPHEFFLKNREHLRLLARVR